MITINYEIVNLKQVPIMFFNFLMRNPSQRWNRPKLCLKIVGFTNPFWINQVQFDLTRLSSMCRGRPLLNSLISPKILTEFPVGCVLKVVSWCGFAWFLRAFEICLNLFNLLSYYASFLTLNSNINWEIWVVGFQK